VAITKLSMVNMQLYDRHMNVIEKIVEINQIKDLDVSWNHFSASYITGLLEYLQ
jgi:hypothetical protein